MCFRLIVVVALAMLLREAAGVRGAESTFHPDVASARAAGEASSPVVLYFSATWCGWCRRMEADVFPSEQAAEAVARCRWVKVDLERHKELAARYGVRTVPSFVMLGPKENLVAARSGYLSSEQLLSFLEKASASPAGADGTGSENQATSSPLSGEALLAALSAGDGEAIERAVAFLARADRARRQELLAAFETAGKPAWPVLRELMENERLAIRAAAAATLDHASRAGLPFHPFADDRRRGEQLAEWSAWLQEAGVEPLRRAAIAEIPEESDSAPDAGEESLLKKSDAPAEAEVPANP